MPTPSLKLYNSLSRKIETFKPIKKGKVSMYACGPTVYQAAHIGNMRTYIFQDLLRRVLEYDGYKVKHVMNITDVGHLVSDADSGEDKVELAAKKTGKRAKDITKHFANLFQKDLKALNIQSPDKLAWVSKYITEQIDFIKRLEKKGYAYATKHGVFFDTGKFKQYEQLGKISVGRSRIKHHFDRKRDSDFALWKLSKPGEKRQQEWKSPWGTGYPGWHLECSVVSALELGQPFDIHLGGEDHRLIHHNSEIAQSEAAYGKPLANYWVHGAFMLMDPIGNLTMRDNTHVCPHCGYHNLVKGRSGYIKKKMPDGDWLLHVRCQEQKCKKVFSGMVKISKSAGNFLTLADLDVDPLAFRYLVISSHYRQRLNFSKSALISAANSLNKLRTLFTMREKSGRICKVRLKRFMSAMNNDLGSPKAVEVVWELAKTDKKSLADKQATLVEFDKVLGLGLGDYKLEVPSNVRKLQKERDKARDDKNWKKSDQLRTKMEKLGYSVKDTVSGSVVTQL